MPNLGQLDTSIYGQTKLFPAPGQQAATGRPLAGPTAAQMKFGADQQVEQDINQLAQQYGDDYDGLVKAVTSVHPDRGLAMGKALEEYRQNAAKTDVENNKVALTKIDMGTRLLQEAIENPTVYPGVRARLSAQGGPQIDQLLPPVDDPDLQNKLVGVVKGALPTKDYLEVRSKAMQEYLDGNKVDGTLMLLAGSKLPAQWDASTKIVKAGGMGDLLQGVTDPATAAQMLADRQALKPQKAGESAKVGSFEDYVTRTYGDNPTPAQILAARKAYGQADDRPRVSVSVAGPSAAAAVAAQTPERVKYWADQIQKDPSFATSPLISGKENSALRTAVANELVTRGQSLDKMTAQTRQMGETAKAILPHISTIEQEAQQLNAKGLMGPLGGRWREFVSGTLKANEIATNAADAQLIGKFQADLGLLRSAVARAHGGARGGGSPTMIEHMKTIIQGGGDFPTFQGSLGAVKEWMQTYADEAKQDTGPRLKSGESQKIGRFTVTVK